MDKILTALRQYERERREKKAVLLLPDGGYYLFDRQFCDIQEYELSLAGKDIHIQGSHVPCVLFIGMVEDTLQWTVKDTGDFQLEQLSLIFHIDLGEGKDMLRGILFIRQQDICFPMFTDPDVEKLYRAVSEPVRTKPPAWTNETLADYAQICSKSDLHTLTSLYLAGKRLSQLREVTGT